MSNNSLLRHFKPIQKLTQTREPKDNVPWPSNDGSGPWKQSMTPNPVHTILNASGIKCNQTYYTLSDKQNVFCLQFLTSNRHIIKNITLPMMSETDFFMRVLGFCSDWVLYRSMMDPYNEMYPRQKRGSKLQE